MSGNVILVLNSYNGTTPVGGGVYKFTDDSSPPVIWTHLNTDAPFLFKSDTQVTNFTQNNESEAHIGGF